MTEVEKNAAVGEPTLKTAAGGLLRSSLVVSSLTMFSRVLGLVRDVVIAFFLGATSNADCFFVAFKIPNFLRRLFAEGAFSQAFVPVLSEYRENGSHASVRALLDRVAGALGGVLMLVTAVAVLGAPVITLLFAPGFHGDPLKYGLTVEMIRITFPYLMLISLTGFAGAILNSYGRFAIPALTPVLLNLCLISAAVFFSPYFDEPAMALAWGVLMAGVVQFLFPLPFLQRLHLLPRPRWDWGDEGVKRILGLMIPALFGVSVSQINLLLDTVLASFLPTGSISWLYYSDRLMELPLGVFAVAIGTVILPSLSRHRAGADQQAFARTLDWGLRSVLLLALPAAVALMVLAQPILVTLFQYGELRADDVAMSVYSLQAYSLGLVAFMLIKVLAPGFFARQDTRTPVKIGIVAMVANMVLNLAFVLPLHHYFQLGHVGLALATSGSAWLNASLLLRGLVRRDAYAFQPGWGLFWLRAAAGVTAMVLLLVAGTQWLGDLSQWTAWHRAWRLLLLCGAGAAVYGGVLVMLGVRLRDFRGVS